MPVSTWRMAGPPPLSRPAGEGGEVAEDGGEGVGAVGGLGAGRGAVEDGDAARRGASGRSATASARWATKK
jgi:hypothetical protein